MINNVQFCSKILRFPEPKAWTHPRSHHVVWANKSTNIISSDMKHMNLIRIGYYDGSMIPEAGVAGGKLQICRFMPWLRWSTSLSTASCSSRLETASKSDCVVPSLCFPMFLMLGLTLVMFAFALVYLEKSLQRSSPRWNMVSLNLGLKQTINTVTMK